MNAPICPDHGPFWLLGDTPAKQAAALDDWNGCEECQPPPTDTAGIAGPSLAEISAASKACGWLVAGAAVGLIALPFAALLVRDLLGRAGWL